MKIMKYIAAVFLGYVIVFTFFLNVGTVMAREEEQEQPKEWGIVKEQISTYQEEQMPFNAEEYYNKTGIWKTMVNTDGKLFSFAKNDKTNQYMLLSWSNKNQLETALPLLKTVPKKYKTGYVSLVPYSNGKTTGYILYRKKNADVFCCLIGKKGKFIQEIPLQKFVEKEIGNGESVPTYSILSAVKINKNREAFLINIGGAWNPCYLFDINIKKNKLVSVEKYNHWLIGADEQYCYGIEIEGVFHFGMHFTNGKLIIEDRKTGKRIHSIEIPNDIITAENDSISQCFDIRNGVVWFANRTGVYFLKSEDTEWTMVMEPQQSSYLNQSYSLTDITVIDENTFSLLLLRGDDDESASILVKYTKQK